MVSPTKNVHYTKQRLDNTIFSIMNIRVGQVFVGILMQGVSAKPVYVRSYWSSSPLSRFTAALVFIADRVGHDDGMRFLDFARNDKEGRST